MDNIKVLFSKDEIAVRVDEIAEQINKIFAGEDELIAICTLKGAAIFYADLIRKINVPLKCEYIKLSSYGSGTVSSQKFSNVSLDISDLNGKNVILVEDIVDSGFTLDFVNKYFKEKYKMKQYKTVALLNKPLARKCEGVDADIYGFEIGNDFVVGYGLDADQKYRNLDFVGLVQ